MLKIALTGGTGTGKSYISRLFLSMGFPVYCADIEAKKLYYTPEIKQKVKDFLGEEVFTGENIDVKKMALTVFSDADKLHFINSLIHPLIMQDFNRWADELNCHTVIMESAIIFENELESFFDLIIAVDAPENTRKERLQKRGDFLTEAMILQRIYSQIPQEEKLKRSDIIIDNSVEKQREIIYKIPV
jgi:dephospho-CoA kinase